MRNLEPEWESRLEPNSFGFRPGRSCHDAIQSIFNTIRYIETDHIIPHKAGGNKLKDNLQVIHRHCHDVKTKTDLVIIKRYKFRKGWEKVYKRFQGQFEKSSWVWDNDLPTLV